MKKDDVLIQFEVHCDWNRCEGMLTWHNLKWYLDRKGCERMPSRPNWSSTWIRKGDKWWCHDLIWGDMWIGTEDIGCCHEHIYVLCGLEKIWQDTLTTNLKY
jgi:hypothetical protein